MSVTSAFEWCKTRNIQEKTKNIPVCLAMGRGAPNGGDAPAAWARRRAFVALAPPLPRLDERSVWGEPGEIRGDLGGSRARAFRARRVARRASHFKYGPFVDRVVRKSHLHGDVLLGLLLSGDDRMPDLGGSVHDDVRRATALERGQHEPEPEPSRAEVHVKLVCWERGWGGACVSYYFARVRRRGCFRGARDAPSGDLNTEASGLTSEMKFIMELNGSPLAPTPAAPSSVGCLLLSALRTSVLFF